MIESAGEHLSDAQIQAYLDGELTLEDERAARQHLETCPVCRSEAEAVDAVFASLAALPEVPLDRDLSPAVLAAIRRSTRPAIPRWLLTVEIVLTGLVIGLAWPFIRGTMDLLTATLPDWISTLTDLAAGWLGSAQLLEFGELVEPALRGWEQFEGLSLPPSLTASLWPILIGAALLWLAGNGLLLRSASKRRAVWDS